jgi:hypothetical protein
MRPLIAKVVMVAEKEDCCLLLLVEKTLTSVQCCPHHNRMFLVTVHTKVDIYNYPAEVSALVMMQNRIMQTPHRRIMMQILEVDEKKIKFQLRET